jgi:hypothetical protein
VLGPDVQFLVGQASLEWGANWELRLGASIRRKGEGRLGDPWLKEDGEVMRRRFKAWRKGGPDRRRITLLTQPLVELSASAGASGIENRDHVPAPEDSPRHVCAASEGELVEG